MRVLVASALMLTVLLAGCASAQYEPVPPDAIVPITGTPAKISGFTGLFDLKLTLIPNDRPGSFTAEGEAKATNFKSNLHKPPGFSLYLCKDGRIVDQVALHTQPITNGTIKLFAKFYTSHEFDGATIREFVKCKSCD